MESPLGVMGSLAARIIEELFVFNFALDGFKFIFDDLLEHD